MHEIQELCQEEYERITSTSYNHIKNKIGMGRVILFGNTRFVKWTLSILKNIEPKYICSLGKPEKNRRYNLEIVSCEKLKEENPDTTYIIITDHDNFNQIRDFLEQNGFFNYCMSCVYNVIPIMQSMESIIELWEFLHDEASKLVLKEILKARIENLFLYSEKMNRNIPVIAPQEYLSSDGSLNEKFWFGENCFPEMYIYYDPKIVNKNQYFPDAQDPFILFHKEEVFVDAGACLGETTLQFMNAVKNQFNKIYMFEPDTHNLNELEKDGRLTNSKIAIVPAGLYSENKVLSFSQDNTMASKIDATGTSQIKVVKLDDAVNDMITYIKMDIEGAEIDAIYGAQEIIKRDKPKCAISIYHRAIDLWQIPLLLKELVPDYKILLRQHTNLWMETVVYAHL